MSFSVKQRTDFGAAVKALRETGAGKQATMYTAPQDLFVDILGYPKTSIVVDTAGARGRPDLTVYAPGGAASSRVSWIVMEAKDEKGAVSTGSKRLKLYAEKAKYIPSTRMRFSVHTGMTVSPRSDSPAPPQVLLAHHLRQLKLPPSCVNMTRSQRKPRGKGSTIRVIFCGSQNSNSSIG